MQNQAHRLAYGLIFSGAPGQFSTWKAAPNGLVLDREQVELLGQIAVRSGASDYRVYPLDPQPQNPVFADDRSIQRMIMVIAACGGVPTK